MIDLRYISWLREIHTLEIMKTMFCALNALNTLSDDVNKMSGNCFIYSIFMQLELTKTLYIVYTNTKHVGCKKAVFKRKNIVYNSYSRREERNFIFIKEEGGLKLNEFTIHSKKLEKEQENKPKERRNKEIKEVQKQNRK